MLRAPLRKGGDAAVARWCSMAFRSASEDQLCENLFLVAAAANALKFSTAICDAQLRFLFSIGGAADLLNAARQRERLDRGHPRAERHGEHARRRRRRARRLGRRVHRAPLERGAAAAGGGAARAARPGAGAAGGARRADERRRRGRRGRDGRRLPARQAAAERGARQHRGGARAPGRRRRRCGRCGHAAFVPGKIGTGKARDSVAVAKSRQAARARATTTPSTRWRRATTRTRASPRRR